MSWKQSIVSHHLSALRSPIRPFILPPHVEQVAGLFANASLPEPADESSGVPPEVERYFDVAAEVCDFVSRKDSEPSIVSVLRRARSFMSCIHELLCRWPL